MILIMKKAVTRRTEMTEQKYADLRIPGIISTKQGSLIRYYECRKSHGDWADIDICVERSTDSGESWETALVLNSGGNTLNNPVMIPFDEQIIFLYCVNYGQIMCSISCDDGMTFSEAKPIHFESDFFYNVVAVGPGHGIVHKNRLLVPIWFAYNREDAKSHHPSFISTLYSDDGGKSWGLGEIIFPNILQDPSECSLAVTADDDVLISIRHECNTRRRAVAISHDGISSWSDLHFEENLPDPICMGGMTHRNGTIYHTNCASETKRVNVTVNISSDCFKTCRKILVSENGGYSDIALLGSKICVFHEITDENGCTALRFKSIDIE